MPSPPSTRRARSRNRCGPISASARLRCRAPLPAVSFRIWIRALRGLPRQNQWSIGMQREITPNFVLEASYVGESRRLVERWTARLRWAAWLSESGFARCVCRLRTVAVHQSGGQSVCSVRRLTAPRSLRAWATSHPYPGLCVQQHSAERTAPVPAVQHDHGHTNSPTGNTWYDSLQVKGTKRLSHGLQVNGTFTWSKALVRIRPNLFVASNKSLADHRSAVSCSMPVWSTRRSAGSATAS